MRCDAFHMFSGCILWMIVCAFLSIFIVPGCMAGVRDDIRQDAIDHNAAKWVIDPRTGEREFVWTGAVSEVWNSIDKED